MNEKNASYGLAGFFVGWIAGSIYATYAITEDNSIQQEKKAQEQRTAESKLETRCKEAVVPKIFLEIGDKKYTVIYSPAGKPQLSLCKTEKPEN